MEYITIDQCSSVLDDLGRMLLIGGLVSLSLITYVIGVFAGRKQGRATAATLYRQMRERQERAEY